HFSDLVPIMRSLPQPVIAAVNGPAIGGGMCLSMGADIRLAAESAYWRAAGIDRKSTRLNSSHAKISYAVFCLKKKTRTKSTRNPLKKTGIRLRTCYSKEVRTRQNEVNKMRLGHDFKTKTQASRTQCLVATRDP